MSRLDRRGFAVLFTLILGVSIYDTWLTIEYSEVMPQMEENPMGQFLILLDHGKVNLFVRCKIAGTLIVMSVLLLLRRIRSRKTLPITGSLAAWQTWLLTYLTFA